MPKNGGVLVVPRSHGTRSGRCHGPADVSSRPLWPCFMTFRIGTHRPLECSCPLWGLRRPACTYRLSPEPTYADVHPPGGVWAAAPTCRSRGLRFEGLTRMFKGLRANDTPRQTPLCPKRRPPRPQPPVFSVFRRGGLHFGLHTTSNRDLTATKRGEMASLEIRHAGDTPAASF